jgi:ubiquinone/menaquinone biosynthesis C-methylase UbiE
VRAWIYDQVIPNMTVRWYRAVLERVPLGARILDVGIGTGNGLSKNADLVRTRDVRVVGVDIDADYLSQCRKRIRKNRLEGRVDVHHTSVLDFHETGFHAAYFSASFMLMPDPAQVLEHVVSLLGPDGRVYFTQTFEEKRNPLMDVAKPLLHRVTTIHFGGVTYEHDFMETVDGAGLEVVEHLKLDGSRARTGRLLVAEPR